MIDSSVDLAMMARAQHLARRGLYTCMPNPRVGCVLVRDGEVIGEGWHRRAGEAHAEVNAIRDAGQRGNTTEGAAAYVTLEPCCHHGKTGPCTEALQEAGIAKVFYGTEDPFASVAGQGLAALRAAGIEVIGPILEEDSRSLNRGYEKRLQQGLPWVRVKMAMSLDGRTAMASGESKWITESAARADVQRLRARSCAIVTGIETVLRDDPSLTVRAEQLGIEEAAVAAQRQPLRVVLDSQGRLPTQAKVLAEDGSVLWVSSTRARSQTLAQNVEQLELPTVQGRIDLRMMLLELAQRQCNEVLVEAGATLAGQFVQQGLVDELVIYMAPKLLGSRARSLFELPLDSMSAQLSLSITDIRAVGSDWRITARPDVET